MNLNIQLPDDDVPALRAKATARGVSAEQYALQVLEQDLAPEWLPQTSAGNEEAGADRPSSDARIATGADLVAAMQASPYREIDLDPVRARLPVRGVKV